MNAQRARQNWFLVHRPDGIVTRLGAIKLIQKHADIGPVMLNEFTDAQICDKLPAAWSREHKQRDMFRDAHLAVANDEHYSSAWANLKRTLAGFLG